MGKIWSKKAKSTGEQLESLDEKIKSIEAYTVSTQEKQKRLIGQFLVISIGLYVISFIIFYFLFFPPTWEKRIVYSTPLLIFPFVIFLIKRLVAWYFQRKVNKNSVQLKELRKEKKELLEQVMDKETYKVALDLLSRFSDKPAVLRTAAQESPRTSLVKDNATTPGRPGGLQPGAPQSLHQRRQLLAATPSHQTPSYSTTTGYRSPYATNNNSNNPTITPYRPTNTPLQIAPMRSPAIRTPFPVIDQRGKGVVEKLVDYLVGDGPSNRFAMICKQCMSHNGMALQEEYEYTAFKCAFCHTLNPARKQRPIAPRLESTPERKLQATVTERRLSSSSSTSDGEKNSGTSESETEQDKPTSSVQESEITETITADAEEIKPEIEKKDD